MKKDKKENKTLGDLIDDIYNKLNFLRDEIQDLKSNANKLTLQGNKILKLLLLEEEKNYDKNEVETMKDFDKEYYIESLIRVLVSDKDFADLQKLLEEYENELSINQYGEA